MKCWTARRASETGILALWLSDLVLARKLGWDAPIPLLATTIAHAVVAAAGRQRPRPGDADWPLHCARAVALAAREAYGLAGDLLVDRRSCWRRAKVEGERGKSGDRMLLDDDAVSPATAPRKPRGCRIAPAGVCSIGWSSSAPCANFRGGRFSALWRLFSDGGGIRRMSRPKRREQEPLFDPELADLPEGARWREWMGRVEAAIFASPTPCRARRWRDSSDRVAISTICSPTFATNCARGPMNSS